MPLRQAAPAIRAVAVFEEIYRRHPEIALGVRRTLEGDVPLDVEKREAGVADMKAMRPWRCEQDARSRGWHSPCA